MKNPIATIAILIGCIVSFPFLRAERPREPEVRAAKKICNCGCDDGSCKCGPNGCERKSMHSLASIDPEGAKLYHQGNQVNVAVEDVNRLVGQWGASIGGKIAPDGKTEIQIDLPGSQHLRNKGGNDRTRNNPRGEPGKGSGLCVFTSIDHCARWANVTSLIDFRDWMTTKPGGGWPQKVDTMIAQKCKELNVAPPEYIQLEGGRELLDILRAALASGRLVGVTYSYSPTGRYGGQKISHMVNLCHLDSQHAVILDNNYIEPKEAAYEWLTIDEFVRTFTGGRAGWAFVLLDAGPPPLPFN